MASSTTQPLCEHTTIKTIHHVNKTKQNKTSKTLQHTVKCEKKKVVECDLGSLQSWRIDFFCKSGGTVLPLFAQLSCLSEHEMPVMEQFGQRSHPPALGSTGTPPSDPLTCAPPTLMPPCEHAPLQPRGIHFLIFLDWENNIHALTMLTSLMP